MNIDKILKTVIGSIRKNIRYIAIGTVALIIIISLVVSNLGGNDQEGITEEVQYEDVQRIALYSNYIETLNPVISKDKGTYFISRLIYDGLFKQDENMTPHENLAQDYEFNSSKGSIEIDLVNAKWHDGEDLTSGDVVFSINAHKAAGSDSHYAGAMDKISYASKDGDDRVIIYFEDNNDMSLNSLTFPILPEHRYDGTYDLISISEDFKPVGTGPYKFKSYSESNSIKLRAYEDYHGEKSENDITCVLQPKGSDPYTQVGTSTVSYYVSEDADRNNRIQRKNMRIVDFPSNQVEFLGFNFDKEYLQDDRVRKAVARTINTDRIINDCYDGSGKKNDNIYFPGYLGVDTSEDAYPYSRRKAANLLELAGYEDSDEDGYLENIDGDTLSLTLLVDGSKEDRTNGAEIIEANLESMGIAVELSVESTSEGYLKSLKGDSWDLFLGGYTIDENVDLSSLIRSEGEDNYTGFSDDKVDELLDTMGSGNTVTETVDTFTNLKERLIDELPYYCLLYKTWGGIKAPALRGKVSSNFTDIYRGCETWYCKYEVSEDKSGGE